MMSFLRGKLSYANVMATMAVVLACGGGSFAVAQEPSDSSGDGGSSTSTSDQNGSGGSNGNGDGDGAAKNLSVTSRSGLERRTEGDKLELQVSADCEDGEVLVGGGVRTVAADDSKPVVASSHPSIDAERRWKATVVNANGNGSAIAEAYALCARE